MTETQTESRLPKVILGAWQLSQGHHRSASAVAGGVSALETLVDVLDKYGAVAIDCADIYTGVEEQLGQMLAYLSPRFASRDLARVRIHTKLVPDREDLHRVDRAYVRRIVERSCQRLGVSCLDLVQFAWWDYGIPGYVDCGLFLSELQQEGLVSQIGVTNFDAPRLKEILDSGVPIASNQLQYSALDHRPEASTVPLCLDRGVSLLCYGTLAGGFLSERWLDAPDPALADGPMALPTRSQTKYRLIITEFGGWEAFQALLRTLSVVASTHGTTVSGAATAYALSLPGVASVIAGATTPERIAQTVEAASLELAPAEVAEIRAHATKAPGPTGPVFGLERTPGSVHASVMKYNLNAGSEDVG